jgi:hypothetical protein
MVMSMARDVSRRAASSRSRTSSWLRTTGSLASVLANEAVEVPGPAEGDAVEEA